MPHPLQIFYGDLTQLGKKPNSIIRSISETGSNTGVMSDQWRVSLYMVTQEGTSYSFKDPCINHRTSLETISNVP